MTILDELPATLRALVMKHIKAHKSLAPSWCHTLRVGYDSEMDSAVATMLGKPQYREACLTFGPQMLDAEDEAEGVVLHELLHLHQEEARDVFLEALDFVPEDFRETFVRRYHYANEGAVCDMARALS